MAATNIQRFRYSFLAPPAEVVARELSGSLQGKPLVDGFTLQRFLGQRQRRRRGENGDRVAWHRLLFVKILACMLGGFGVNKKQQSPLASGRISVDC